MNILVKLVSDSTDDRFLNKSKKMSPQELLDSDENTLIEYLACLGCSCNSSVVKENGDFNCFGECIDYLYENCDPKLEFEFLESVSEVEE